jgi:hypothetical protein
LTIQFGLPLVSILTMHRRMRPSQSKRLRSASKVSGQARMNRVILRFISLPTAKSQTKSRTGKDDENGKAWAQESSPIESE